MDWSEIAKTIVWTVLVPSIPIIVAAVVKVAKAKAAESIATVSNAAIKTTLTEASDAVATAVTYTAQTFVDDLKAAGTFDAAAQKAALATALGKALILISTESKTLIANLYGNLEEWLTTKIEQQVKDQKVATTVISEVKTT